MKRERVLQRIKGSLAVAAIAAALSSPALAFHSVKKVQILCTAMTGGVRQQFLKISHTPLIQTSPVTREAIIVGEAGFETPSTPPPFAQRLTTAANLPASSRQIRVWVEYRFLPPLQSGFGDIVDTPAIDGPDPMAFAFQINPSSITAGGRLQYRILAQRLNSGVPASTETVSYPRLLNGTTQWFDVGVAANAAQVFGAQGGRFTLADGNPADGETSLDIPRGLLSDGTVVTLEELKMNDPSIPGGLTNAYRVYKMTTDKTVANGSYLLNLLYPDFTYPNGQDGLIDGTNIPESKIGIAWWDGFMWRSLGGKVNAQSNLVTAKIGSQGFFAVGLFAAPSPEDRRPMQKIITPNGDGKNDYAEFLFSDLVDNIKVEIFDINGHRVRTLYSAVDTQGWDGRDDSGGKVESGVYIYQYTVDGKRVSGLIAVAK